ncbi:MAG TPA: AGE family epimerase/isomerase [Lapillicoccus sp.]|nr:AGE family epimerase/isomerase [Lapillicoccus sp.]
MSSTASPATRLSEADLEFLVGQTTSLVDFAKRSRHPDGGFGWLDDDGNLLVDRPVELWITCRMLHVLALAEILGDESCRPFVDAGLDALRGRLRDPEFGGWYASITTDGKGSDVAADDSKPAYAHAFVILATASAVAAGHEDARPILDDALAVFDRSFWRDGDGMAVDVYDRTFEHADPYRGVNANMHTVEALLAAHDVTGDEVHLQRALTITSHVVNEFARNQGYRLPEHYDEHWNVLLDYNRDQPRDRFRPYGVTIGHLMEWARLALHVRTALVRTGAEPPAWLLDDAKALFDRGVEDGWQEADAAQDRAEGFVYTTDFDANPVVADRLHWVVTEAVATAWTLALLTGDDAYRAWFDRWVEHAREYFVDEAHGSWRHELDPQNRPSHNVWEGKPDVYHAYQAMLLPRLGEVSSFVDGARRLIS